MMTLQFHRRRRPLALVMVAALIAPFAGCDHSASTTATAAVDPRIKLLPTVDVLLAGRSFKLEVADRDPARTTGLMYRTSMANDHGMLFVFQIPVEEAFWMKNTLIPLDIAYIDSDGTVIHIAQMQPNDLTSIESDGVYQYAIELNQGVTNAIGLREGDHVEIPASVRPPAPTTEPSAAPAR